jgi:hypothetical protein
MNWDWLSGIKGIADIAGALGELMSETRATKDLLLRELKINIKAFERAQKDISIDYDNLLELLQNQTIQEARKSNFRFSTIKRGVIDLKQVKDDRNKKYAGKNCEWLFKNIDEKIEDLRNQKKYHGSLNKIRKSSIALQFSNLFYKMKLLADFINE